MAEALGVGVYSDLMRLGGGWEELVVEAAGEGVWEAKRPDASRASWEYRGGGVDKGVKAMVAWEANGLGEARPGEAAPPLEREDIEGRGVSLNLSFSVPEDEGVLAM